MTNWPTTALSSRGIALFGLGFVVAKVALIVRPESTGTAVRGLYSGVGILSVLCGGAVVVVGYLQHTSLLNILERDEAAPRPRWPLTITAVAVAASVLLSALIVVST